MALIICFVSFWRSQTWRGKCPINQPARQSTQPTNQSDVCGIVFLTKTKINFNISETLQIIISQVWVLAAEHRFIGAVAVVVAVAAKIQVEIFIEIICLPKQWMQFSFYGGGWGTTTKKVLQEVGFNLTKKRKNTHTHLCIHKYLFHICFIQFACFPVFVSIWIEN